MVAAFLHAARLGMFDISWNVLCPGCGGVLDTNATLKTVQKDEYVCALCADGYAPTLDEMVEVTFTVSPRVRRIAAHNPDELPLPEYFRQMYWGSGVDLPDEDYEAMVDDFVVDHVELAPGEKAVLSVQLPAEFIIVFEPVTHSAQFIDVKGEPTRERQNLSLAYDRDHTHNQTLEMRPGPLRMALENRTDTRVLPTVFIAGDTLHDLLGQPAAVPHRQAAAHQPDVPRPLPDRHARRRPAPEDHQPDLPVHRPQRLDRALRAGRRPRRLRPGARAFPGAATRSSRPRPGAVVKTIGDAVMATFPTPDRAIAAALRMREAMRELNEQSGREDLLLKIGVHEGPCIAVTMNERQDYFGQTVNIASRVQGLANSQSIFATGAVVDDSKTADLLQQKALTPQSQRSRCAASSGKCWSTRSRDRCCGATGVGTWRSRSIRSLSGRLPRAVNRTTMRDS